MRQLTVEDLLAETAAAEYPAGRWEMSGGAMRWVGLITGRPSTGQPDRMMVIGVSFLSHSRGWRSMPNELDLRRGDMADVDPTHLQSGLVVAVEEACMATERERLETGC